MYQLSILRSTRAVGAAGLVAASLGLAAAPAFGAAQTSSIPADFVFDLGPSPVGLPGSCPFANTDASLTFLSGTMVQHDTTNKNGDWGGGTIEGLAQFSENGGAALYTGHATIWFGGGNNAQQQTEGGFTLDYTGTGSAGTLRIHVDQHNTINNSGVSTANVNHVTVVCG